MLPRRGVVSKPCLLARFSCLGPSLYILPVGKDKPISFLLIGMRLGSPRVHSTLWKEPGDLNWLPGKEVHQAQLAAALRAVLTRTGGVRFVG